MATSRTRAIQNHSFDLSLAEGREEGTADARITVATEGRIISRTVEL